jgi:hypothetical protein
MLIPPGSGGEMRGAHRGWAVAAAAGVALLLAAAATTAMTGGRPRPREYGATSVPAARPAPTSSMTLPSRLSASSQPAPPAVVTIPALGVRARVQPVGTSNGELGVPTDPARLGWWTGSAGVGASRGTVVIDGHVDSAATGPGALFRLQELHASDRIVVATTTGRQQPYLVTGQRVYVKADGLPPELFSAGGAPRLVLITCGGPFDPTTGSYLDNIVVFAAPA